MKLNLRGDVSRFYAETLCLLFYPGSKFSESDKDDGISVSVDFDESGETHFARVEISDGGATYKGSASLLKSEPVSRPSMIKKIVLGKAFLEAGKAATGIVPPWGILTGVRPSKLALWELEAGRSADDVVDIFARDYGTTRDKASLAAKVAKAENDLLSKDYSGKSSLYIAIPFCPSRCSYCSFVSYTSARLLSLIPEYLEVLKREIKRTSILVKQLGQKISTIYIGGGTPTILDEEQLEQLLGTVDSSFDVSALDEFTLEGGRPDTINREKMLCALRHGVTRVSVNTQTLNNNILSSIGRHHTASDFLSAYEITRNAGIENINVDLIAGLPGETSDSFSRSVDAVSELKPENVTVHAFCVKKSAELRQSGVYGAKSEDAARSVAYSQSALMSRSYLPYYMYRQKNAVGNLENVGFSLPGHEGIYNVLMMEEVQSIFAVGASAVTKIVLRDKKGKPYIKRFAENKYPYEYLREKCDDGSAERIASLEGEIIKLYSEFGDN